MAAGGVKRAKRAIAFCNLGEATQQRKKLILCFYQNVCERVGFYVREW